MNEEIKLLKEKLKKKNEAMRGIKNKLRVALDDNEFYRTRYYALERKLGKQNRIVDSIPRKYYTIKCRAHSNGGSMMDYEECIEAVNPRHAISLMEDEYYNFKFVSIAEVAS
jgi:chromosome segregation ATPase